jgi:pimeloyl-ACP methyl ester carboxylesterase
LTRDPPALVLLPGLDGTGDLFEPLLSRLDPSIERVVVRYPLAEPVGYEELTAIARRALPKAAPYVILGESFSGPIAAQLAAERSGELRGLILCASLISSPMPHLRPFEWLLDVGPVWSVARLLAPRLLLGRFRTRERSALLARTLARLPRGIVVVRVRAAQGANAIAAFASVGVPTMYLQGTEDALVPRSCADEVCRLAPRTRIVKIEAPHCVLQCAPEDAAHAIGQFLKSL